MSKKEYILEKIGFFFLLFFLFILSGLYLYLTGTDLSILFICFFLYGITFTFYFCIDYHKTKEKFLKLDALLDHLEKPYLLPELLEYPDEIIEKKYYEVLKRTMKSAIEKMKEVEIERKEYKEYIEEWVHEIKTPIAALSLICENHSFPKKKAVKKELFSIEEFVEQVLFYARSEKAEKDYFIKKETLEEMIHKSLIKYRNLVLEDKIEVKTEKLQVDVYTDPKWITFIIDQILSNCIKYMDKENKKITISASVQKEGIILSIEDNGKGIQKEDLSRVFEKGFTGGDRHYKNATGMGLYLSKKLCDKLGHSIWIESEKGKYTKVFISFPIGDLHKF